MPEPAYTSRALRICDGPVVMQTREFRETKKLLLMQLFMLLLISGILLPFDLTLAASAFSGGLIAIISALTMALLAYRKYTAQYPERVLANFYVAEIARILVTAVGFALAIVLQKPLSIITLISVFFVLQVLPAIMMNIAGFRG